MENNIIVVTGGAGYVGSHICKALSRSGFLPVTVDNLSRGYAALVKFGPLEKLDIRDESSMQALLARYRARAVIHCAGYIAVGESVVDPALYYEHNVIGTLRLLSAMRAAQVPNIIFSSSCAVHGMPSGMPIREDMPRMPISPYGRSKLMMEQAIEDFSSAYDLKYMILRYYNACGADPEGETGECHDPETHLIPLLLQAAFGGKPLSIFGCDYPTPDGTAIRDFIHVSDLAQAHVLALQKLLSHMPSNIINIGVGKGYSVREVIAAAEHFLGKPVPVIIANRRAGDAAILYADTTKMRSVLQFMPVHSSLQSILTTATQWEKNKKL
jgi:UDP-arabinose 4-epimerase